MRLTCPCTLFDVKCFGKDLFHPEPIGKESHLQQRRDEDMKDVEEKSVEKSEIDE